MMNLWEKENIPLYDEEKGQIPTMEAFLIDSDKPVGAIIIFPGGGYHHLSLENEGSKIAEFYNAQGFNAFVVTYRLAPYNHPAMLYDALRAIRTVRYNAEKFNVNPDRIAVMGFSAGGHLASSLYTHYDFEVEVKDEIDKVSARPDAAILCYGVLSLSSKYAHIGSRNNLLSDYSGEDYMRLSEFLSAEKQVTEDTPPAFLWHTAADPVVPVSNSIDMAKALSEKKIPFELHIYPTGGHGMGLAHQKPHVTSWAPLSAAWLKDELGFDFAK